MKDKTLAVFQHLITCAVQGHTTTYQETALATGLPSEGNALGAALTPLLTDIFVWCKSNRLPHLTSLVVRKSGQDVGLPGHGFWSLMELPITTSRKTRASLATVLQNEVFRMYRGLGEAQVLHLNLPEDKSEARLLLDDLIVAFKESQLEFVPEQSPQYFPLEIEYSEGSIKTRVIIDKPSDLISGMPFTVIRTNAV